eukprot:6006319-Prymnesium_polylepis.1
MPSGSSSSSLARTTSRAIHVALRIAQSASESTSSVLSPIFRQTRATGGCHGRRAPESGSTRRTACPHC